MTPDHTRSLGPHQSFYASALTEADRVGLEEASHVDGLAQEIALLRLRLRSALADHAEDAKLVETGVKLLIQSLLAHQRISPEQADEVLDSVGGLLEQLTQTIGGPADV